MRLSPFSIKVLLLILFATKVPCLQAEETSVKSLINQLNSKDVRKQIEAVNQISDLGPLAGKAVPALIKSAQSDDLVLQHESIIALGRIGEEAKDGAAMLIKKLDNKSVIIQYSAIQALRRIGDPDKKQAIPKLKSILNSAKTVLRVGAAWTLATIEPDNKGQINESIPVLIEGLKSDNSHIRNDAMLALHQIGKPAISAITQLLGHDEPAQCSAACDTLAEIGPEAKEALPELLALFDSSKSDVCWHAVRAVGSIGSNADTIVPKLNKLLSHESSPVLISAVNALGRYGDQAAPSIGDLIPLLSHEDPTVRIEAAKTLGAIGPKAADAIPELYKAIKNDKNGSVTIYAADALGGIGKKAVPSLTKILDDKDYRILAASILAEIGPEAKQAVPSLTQMLSDKDEEVQLEAFFALASIGPEAKEASPVLLNILENSSDDKTQVRAIYTLTKMQDESIKPVLQQLVSESKSDFVKMISAWALVTLEPDNKDYIILAVPELIKMLQSEKPISRYEAANMLGTIGAPAKSAIPSLEKMMNDPDPAVQATVLSAIADIGVPSSSLLSTAIKILEDPVMDVRLSAIHLIGEMGESGRPAVSSLRPFLKSNAPPEQMVAAWALVHISESPEILSLVKPLLIKAITHEDPRVRVEVASTFGEFYKADDAIKGALQDASTDKNKDVQKAAKDALDNLNNN